MWSIHAFSGVLLAAMLPSIGAGRCLAGPLFFGTSDPAQHWFVSTNVDRDGDGSFASFKTDNFLQAVNTTYSQSRLDWIADEADGSQPGGVGNWTFFVFRQTFDLAGYKPGTANLTFRWAADDSGEIVADRGSWIPAFSLNGGAFTTYPGSTPDHRIPTYGFCDWISLTSGFVEGINTIDFYVQGNGMTDGFGLQVQSFTADAVPGPAGFVLCISMGMIGRRRRG